MGFSLLISSSAWSIETPWRISTEFHWIMPLSIARLRTDSTFFALTIATLLCSVEMIGPARYSTPSLSANLGISGARFRKKLSDGLIGGRTLVWRMRRDDGELLHCFPLGPPLALACKYLCSRSRDVRFASCKGLAPTPFTQDSGRVTRHATMTV